MALDMTPEQKATGKDNFARAVGKLAEADAQTHERQGVSRRRFMQGLIASGATVPISAAAYFGYSSHGFPRDFRAVKAGIIGCGDEGGVLVGEHNPHYVKFVACADIRPTNQRRIFRGEPTGPRRGLNHHYGSDAKSHIQVYDDYRQLLERSDIEMVVIALPLHLHAKVAIEAMEHGKHVLCEKLMAWNITQCKQMIQAADRTGKLLSIGHQRHYSMLYAHANEVIASGVLGDFKHIRALWHRNNARPNPDPNTNRERPMLDSWWPVIPADDRRRLEADIRRHGYKSMEELVRWRIYTRTGGGLMAELGSHQLDACSIFLGKRRPIAVTAVGGTNFYTGDLDRECEDHVYCIYEFPGPNYDPRNAGSRKNDVVTVTYSSINTNGFEKYGECIMGTKGTLVIEEEQSAMLWGIQGRSTQVTVSTGAAPTIVDASATAPADVRASAPGQAAAAATGQNALGHAGISRGYREEMDHLAFCIRMQGQGMEADNERLKPRCDGRTAMADAIIALTANQAMKRRVRIEFQDDWFDAARADVPDADMREEEV